MDWETQGIKGVLFHPKTKKKGLSSSAFIGDKAGLERCLCLYLLYCQGYEWQLRQKEAHDMPLRNVLPETGVLNVFNYIRQKHI